MRTSGFIISFLAITIIGCKTSSVTTSSAEPYKEDLSVWREDLSMTDELVETKDEEEVIVENTVVPKGHLKAELDSINQIMINNNRKQRFLDGYTIQIYTGNDREAATAAMEKAVEVNPEVKPQIAYYQPSYKVKVGQYLDRLKAHEVFESLKQEFPLALLIPERIKVDYD